MKNHKDISIIRELAKKYAEIAARDIQSERRKLWTAHNSLKYYGEDSKTFLEKGYYFLPHPPSFFSKNF